MPVIVTPAPPVPYFTVAEARALQPLNDAATYPDAAIDAARVGAEEAIEEACGVAFVPRTAAETLDGAGATGLALRWPKVRTVTSASVDGTALTAAELLEVKTTSTGLYWPAYWAVGTSNLVVEYEHGFDVPPYRGKSAALRLTKHFLIDNPGDDRVLRVDTDAGAYVMSTPGMRGQSFGIPEVDSFIADYNFRLGFS